MNNVVALNTIKSQMQSDFRQFVKDQFSLTNDQKSYFNDIPDEILISIGNNLVHALENGYSISFDINSFAKGFNTPLGPVPTWGNSRIQCRIGSWTEHQSSCNYTQHWGIQCNF